ncbi:hypothetical protein [Nostoc sp.]|uniref:hypothetical protein n=1 Tax=Nostoc sp. TaxID=1180 RepID=UPI002A5FA9E9|nr:hypothetical protein [Nostoc sp. S13]
MKFCGKSERWFLAIAQRKSFSLFITLLGERVAAFEKDLEDTLLAIQPSGQFQESILLEALLAWRK